MKDAAATVSVAYLTILAISDIASPLVHAVAGHCAIDFSSVVSGNYPLFLNPVSQEVYYPSSTNNRNILKIKQGKQVTLFCASSKKLIEKRRAEIRSTQSSQTLRCQGDNNFYDSKNVTRLLSDYACSETPEPKAKEVGKCSNGSLVQLGYELPDPKNFNEIIELCFAKHLATTFWARGKVLKVIGFNKNNAFAATAFKALQSYGYFKDLLISKVYPLESQITRFREIFEGDSELANRFLNRDSRQHYLVKGHLVARADLLYPAEQYSTYVYLNVLPMWQCINNGNWKVIEKLVRDTATRRAADLDVWTGGIGLLQLKGKNIYLAKHKDKSKNALFIPVPKLLFKLVIDRETNAGLVFITANDPYLQNNNLPDDYKICQAYESCSKKFHSINQDASKGYSYCCFVHEFLNNSIVRKLGLPVDEFANVQPLNLV